MKISYKQRKSPKGTEIYFWDYSQGRKANRGFGVILLEGRVGYLLHFNKLWDGADDFICFDISPKEVKKLRMNNPVFKFHCELR